ncbi:hypothetical protein SAMD00019534_013960 [Acytostelium subglobosum LB1]|uniref:hypothetical protein n=1 Tax=Acytostelium subglobosum LB1 TaxID=1410327 RepID=UPI000644D04D|nr:hypothetical protein SAMD00019534_013960 [Acytostelium subglobosum LB1]GAM18221.1 hypothetical protein SAMD00019534_013960 [Acytostelium subglobosum LB1]|eukprot:XP_012758817.1 hypothetical protein SAMD00019534_013960 [Acytostelium subglobosum LB1]
MNHNNDNNDNDIVEISMSTMLTPEGEEIDYETPPQGDEDMFCDVGQSSDAMAMVDMSMLIGQDNQQMLEEEILDFNETPLLNDIITANNNNNNNNSNNDGHRHAHNHLQIGTQQHCHCVDIDSFIELMTTENPYILSGFREFTTRSFKQCTKSVFMLHNDTGNIWTHLIPAILYLVVFVKDLLAAMHLIPDRHQDRQHTPMYLMNLLFFLATCFLCFLASSIYHTYRSHSITVYKRTLMLDVSFIGLLILTSVNLIIYSELYCFPNIRSLFLFSFLFLIVTALSLLPKMMREKKFSLRTFVFSFLALQGLVSHMLRLYLESGGMSSEPYTFGNDSNFQWLLLSYGFFGIGLSIRRLRFPEILAPGKFDIFVSSHQIFHVLVALGTLFIFKAYGNGTEVCQVYM